MIVINEDTREESAVPGPRLGKRVRDEAWRKNKNASVTGRASATKTARVMFSVTVFPTRPSKSSSGVGSPWVRE